jgi:hypothetical protein
VPDRQFYDYLIEVGPAHDAGHGRDLVRQRQQLGDVVAVAAGQ